MTSVTVAGQATSAIPYGNSIAAAYGPGIVRFNAQGKYTTLAATSAAPFRLVPDSSGGLGYEALHSGKVSLYRFDGGRAALVGSAPERSVQLVGSGGKLWLTGAKASQLRALPSAWRALDVPAGSVISSAGELAVTGAVTGPRSARDPQGSHGSAPSQGIGASALRKAPGRSLLDSRRDGRPDAARHGHGAVGD